jgi:NitT/TauT family transport system substrate-binding protein
MSFTPVQGLLRRSLCITLAVLGLSAAVPAAAQPATEPLTVLLPAPPNSPAFAPWMIAVAKGYFAQEGLKLEFVTGKGGVDVAKQLGAGNALIGGGIGDTPIIVRANGVPVKAVAVLGGGSVTMISVHDDSPVKTVKDLKGRTVTVMSYADTTYYSLLGSLNKADLAKTDVNAQAAGPAGVWQLFVAKKADAMAGVPDWVVDARGAGAKVRLLPASENFGSMAQAILASDDTIKNKPELVQKVVRATLKGLAEIMKDPKAAAATYCQQMPAHKGREAYIEEVFALYREHVYPGQKVPGAIDPARMASVQKFYVSEGIVAKATPLDELYTNQFVGH